MDTHSPNSPLSPARTETAVFAAGCFWGVEATFRSLDGVTDTQVGYVGGEQLYPTYKQVCGGRTGHAEAVKVIFDPARISYEDLLQTFWENHNPTQRNRQGMDFGSQYRSAIFPQSDEQRLLAERSKLAMGMSGRFRKPIATRLEPASHFWPAEDYHQQYLEKARTKGVCRW